VSLLSAIAVISSSHDTYCPAGARRTLLQRSSQTPLGHPHWLASTAMPNPGNISAPINIHGIGRSGTTLLQNILGATDDLQVCNETLGLVFAPYRGGELTSGSADRDTAPISGAVAAVHAALCAVLPSGKRRWCQKLGGLPNLIIWDMINDADRDYATKPYPFPYTWYWRVLRESFPNSCDVLIIRDYRDVIISRHQYSGWKSACIASDVAVYFNLLAHPAAKIDHLVRYEELVADPNGITGCLLAHLGLEATGHPSRALAWHASPSKGETLADARKRAFSWADRHSEVITDEMRQTVSTAVRRLERRLGLTLGM
jgi:hypothetical protein